MKIDPDNKADLSAQIAGAIREEIMAGRLIVDDWPITSRCRAPRCARRSSGWRRNR
jgi:hypothetical protein